MTEARCEEILIMETIRSSVTSVLTVSEGGSLHSHRRENLKS
jgi:hypothetical protein